MNLQNVIVTALVVVLASVALAAGSYYFIGSALQPDLVRPAAPPAPPAPTDTADRNLMALSFERIKEATPEEFKPREVTRNPFLWPEEARSLLAERETRKAIAAKEVKKDVAEPRIDEPQHTLKFVMIGEVGKVAFIDRGVFFEGDALGPRTVHAIEPLRVVLTAPDRDDLVLTMAEPPGMIAYHERERRQPEPRRAPPAIPTDDDPAGQLRYLMQEVQMMQEGKLP